MERNKLLSGWMPEEEGGIHGKDSPQVTSKVIAITNVAETDVLCSRDFVTDSNAHYDMSEPDEIKMDKSNN